MTPAQRIAEAIEDMQRAAREETVKLMEAHYGSRMDAMNASIGKLEKEVREVKTLILNGRH